MHETNLEFAALAGGTANGLLDYWSITPFDHVAGDFNINRLLDVQDIDILSAEVRAATGDLRYDLNADSTLDHLDREVWVYGLKNTYFGDANLDGEFNTADLVAVFQAGKYETENPASWGGGDWNGDGVFDSGDWIVAFRSGGFEQGPRRAVSLVPEPTSASLVALAAGVWIGVRRLRRRTGSG